MSSSPRPEEGTLILYTLREGIGAQGAKELAQVTQSQRKGAGSHESVPEPGLPTLTSVPNALRHWGELGP
jgi:hypothetical protein